MVYRHYRDLPKNTPDETIRKLAIEILSAELHRLDSDGKLNPQAPLLFYTSRQKLFANHYKFIKGVRKHLSQEEVDFLLSDLQIPVDTSVKLDYIKQNIKLANKVPIVNRINQIHRSISLDKKIKDAQQYKEQMYQIQSKLSANEITRWADFRKQREDIFEAAIKLKKRRQLVRQFCSIFYAAIVVERLSHLIMGVRLLR